MTLGNRASSRRRSPRRAGAVRRPGALLVLPLLLVPAACGVPTGGDPRVVDRSAVPYGLLEPGKDEVRGADDAPGAGEVGGRIALVTPENHVRLVPRAVPSGAPGTVSQAL